MTSQGFQEALKWSKEQLANPPQEDQINWFWVIVLMIVITLIAVWWWMSYKPSKVEEPKIGIQ